MHIHILGICGTFMGGLAVLAKEAGHKVTGCDANVYPPMSEQLEGLGIELVEGFGEEQLAHGIGRQRVRHQRPDLAGQAPPPGDESPTATGQVGQEGKHARVAAIDVVDQQQDGPPAQEVTDGLAPVLQRTRK